MWLSKTTKLLLLDSLLQEVCIESGSDGSLILSLLGLSVCLVSHNLLYSGLKKAYYQGLIKLNLQQFNSTLGSICVWISQIYWAPCQSLTQSLRNSLHHLFSHSFGHPVANSVGRTFVSNNKWQPLTLFNIHHSLWVDCCKGRCLLMNFEHGLYLK
jgi:hypothetical protein